MGFDSSESSEEELGEIEVLYVNTECLEMLFSSVVP